MICGRLADFEKLGLQACGPVTMQGVAWIRSLPLDPREGTFDLGAGIRALILRYPTAAEATGRFETHRRHVDLQYTLTGCEVLEWSPRQALEPFGDYDEEKDVCFYQPGAPAGRVVAGTGVFTVFTPHDAHRGGVRFTSSEPEVLKLVVKIPVSDFLLSK
ncbi:MAG TPA: YhcH/YjgK/YiaL family protein [Opitutaceae bacterium]|nr:YhcH/YjgK/YiaL family protein [Opitutaceae bacterium]